MPINAGGQEALENDWITGEQLDEAFAKETADDQLAALYELLNQ